MLLKDNRKMGKVVGNLFLYFVQHYILFSNQNGKRTKFSFLSRPGSASFCLFPLCSEKICRKNCRLQRDPNSDYLTTRPRPTKISFQSERFVQFEKGLKILLLSISFLGKEDSKILKPNIEVCF